MAVIQESCLIIEDSEGMINLVVMKSNPQRQGYNLNMSNLQRPKVIKVIPIPKDKVGLVIGRKGSRLQEIRDQTGVQVCIKDNHAHLRGTAEQCQNAEKMIEEILKNSREERYSSQGGFKKLNITIPENLMGLVIGKGRQNLNNIETKTGVALKIINNSLYIKGSTKKTKEAVREIKDSVKNGMRRSQLTVPVIRFVHVDTAQLEENYEFELSVAQPSPNITTQKCFKLQLLEHPLKEETSSDFADTESLREKFLEVLKQIHKEKEEEMVIVDIWCHFGHAYLTNVDEDEEGEMFTLKEIKDKIKPVDGARECWRTFFAEVVDRIEVEEIEKCLTTWTATDDIRYDFTFLTPSCRDVRVKVWLIEKQPDDEGASACSLAFRRSAPLPVRNSFTQVLPDEHTGDASNSPCFHICFTFHQRMKIDILIPSKGFDCRLKIRTCPKVPKTTPQAKEEDEILRRYLMQMKIVEGQLRFPPITELPDGFDLFFQRRSLRRTYQYKLDDEQFTLTVCKDQAKEVHTDQTDVCNFDETEAKPDVHLHCEEWDQVLNEGNWEPEQIVAKLPTFLKFLRQVQRNVAPQEPSDEGL